MKIRIAIFQKDLRLGGIQKSLINLMGLIDTDRYEIDLYLFSTENFYDKDFPKEVNIIYKSKQNYFVRFIPYVIYHAFKSVDIDKNYDLAIDFDGYQSITAAYALKTRSKKHVYWVHNDHYVREFVQESHFKNLIYRLLRLSSMNKWRQFNTFVGVSEGVLEGFRADFPEKESIVIPNAINVDDIFLESSYSINDLVIDNKKLNLAMLGRLEHQKGIDLLIPKIAEVVKKRNDIHLYLIGDGSLRLDLEKQIKTMGLRKHVTLLGAKKNPFKYISKMDGLILFSRYEGQGMVLMEATALGLNCYFPKHLEKYNTGLTGVDDIVESLASAQKIESYKTNRLDSYNSNIINKINILFSGRRND